MGRHAASELPGLSAGDQKIMQGLISAARRNSGQLRRALNGWIVQPSATATELRRLKPRSSGAVTLRAAQTAVTSCLFHRVPASSALSKQLAGDPVYRFRHQRWIHTPNDPDLYRSMQIAVLANYAELHAEQPPWQERTAVAPDTLEDMVPASLNSIDRVPLRNVY